MTWKSVEIGSVCLATNQRDPQRDPYDEFVYVDITSVDNQAKRLNETQRIRGKDAPSRARKEIRAGDILVSTVRPNLNAVALVPPGLDGQIASTGFCVLRPNTKFIDKKYLFYRTISTEFVSYLSSRVTGANYPAVSDSVVKSAAIPLPPLPIQKQIAAILEKADAARKKRRQANKLTEQFLQSAFLEMFGDPVTNPKGWKKKALDEICKKINDGTHFSPPMVEIGVPYITAKHIKKYGMDFDSKPTFISENHHREIYKKCDPAYGDVLYIKDGATTGIAALNRYSFEFSMLSSLALLKPDTKFLTGEYLCFCLNDDRMKKGILTQMSGGAIKRLTVAKIKKIMILVPPISLQKKFATLVEKVESLRAKQCESEKELENLFNALMQRAFRGELVG